MKENILILIICAITDIFMFFEFYSSVNKINHSKQILERKFLADFDQTELLLEALASREPFPFYVEAVEIYILVFIFVFIYLLSIIFFILLAEDCTARPKKKLK